MIRKLVLVLVAGLCIAQLGCAKRIPVTYNELENDVYVRINTKTGENYKGIVRAKNENFIVLQPEVNTSSFNKVTKENIDQIYSKPPVYDYENKVVSEFEIQNNKKSKTTILYTIGGAGLSFGTSFFIGSLLHRNLKDTESKNTALWTVTGLGTCGGTLWFANMGNRKDRENSIMAIREHRYHIAQKEMIIQKEKRDQVNDEMEKMKAERAKQDAEMKRLMERLKDREQK